jgi:hypothetical protein
MEEGPLCKKHLGKSLITIVSEHLKFCITCLASSHWKGVCIPAVHFYFKVFIEFMMLILLFKWMKLLLNILTLCSLGDRDGN